MNIFLAFACQLQKLNDVLEKPSDWNSMGLEGNCKDMYGKSEAKCCLQEGLHLQCKGNIDSYNNVGEFGEEGHELLNTTTSQHVDASPSLENWYSFDPARWHFRNNG